jgi:antitoxin MazE
MGSSGIDGGGSAAWKQLGRNPGGKRQALAQSSTMPLARAFDALPTIYDIIKKISFLAVRSPMQVSKWGNSLAVRLPKALVERLRLGVGDDLEIVEASEKRIVVRKAERSMEALARMAERNWLAPADYRFDRDEANAR